MSKMKVGVYRESDRRLVSTHEVQDDGTYDPPLRVEPGQFAIWLAPDGRIQVVPPITKP